MSVHDLSPAAITTDGFLDPGDDPSIAIHPTYNVPVLSGNAVFQLRDDTEVALATRFKGAGDIIDMNGGRNGHSQFGMTVQGREGAVQIDKRRRMVVPVDLLSLRGAQMRHEVRDRLLGTVLDLAQNDPRGVRVGRLALVDTQQAIGKEYILRSLDRHRLWLPEHVDRESDITEDGIISIGLDDLHFLFCEENFEDTESQRRAIMSGKHGLRGIVEKQEGRPEEINGREFFLGGIRISIGPYVAVIEPETNDPEVLHLAARILDGIRITGSDVVRHVSLFNSKLESVFSKDLKVRMRLYHAPRHVQDLWDRVGSESTIVNGVSFTDVIQVRDHPEQLTRILKQVGPTPMDYGPYGILVGNNKMAEIPWLETAGTQNRLLRRRNELFDASDPTVCKQGGHVDHYARAASQVLGMVGREQNEGRVCFTWAFPNGEVMQQMLDAGTGVFAAHDLRQVGDEFAAEAPMLGDDRLHAMDAEHPTHDDRYPKNQVYFDANRFAEFQRLHQQGARLIMVRHPIKDQTNGNEVMPGEVLVWDEHGFWVRPSEQERLKSIDTLITMYGSHVAGVDKVLEPQIERFALRMKKRFGSNLAFMHGKGPGVMLIADQIAANLMEIKERHAEFATDDAIDENIFSIGIGIDAERFNQSPNFHPPGQADFDTNDRLIRQKHMNDRATFNVFNIGGAGTLEEVALTLCSHKLHKNLLTPMIFVDPVGCANDGQNLFAKLREFIVDMATKKEFDLSDRDAAIGTINVQLLSNDMAGFVHVVSSYDEAADIIEGFADDPVAYYLHEDRKTSLDAVVESYAEAGRNMELTKFGIPAFLDPETILQDERWHSGS